MTTVVLPRSFRDQHVRQNQKKKSDRLKCLDKIELILSIIAVVIVLHVYSDAITQGIGRYVETHHPDLYQKIVNLDYWF